MPRAARAGPCHDRFRARLRTGISSIIIPSKRTEAGCTVCWSSPVRITAVDDLWARSQRRAFLTGLVASHFVLLPSGAARIAKGLTEVFSDDTHIREADEHSWRPG